MKRSKWIYYAVVGILVLVYFATEATDLLFPGMLIILPVGFWGIWNVNPDKPSL